MIHEQGGIEKTMSQISSEYKICAVIVTYKRQRFLGRLFDSLLQMDDALWGVVLVDNENSDVTRKMAEDFQIEIQKNGSDCHVDYYPQSDNVGGSGGFSRGISRAYSSGANWLWVMDDDVEVVRGAISNVKPLFEKYGAIMGDRLDIGGKTVLQPYWLNSYFGIANPFRRDPFRHANNKIVKTNILCFEGSFISRQVISAIGTSDPRFFIYWDDVCYGYRASKVADVVRVNVPVVRRTRDTNKLSFGDFSVDEISNLKRYYMIRNRGLLAEHMSLVDDFHPIAFNLGSCYVFFKEILRMLLTNSFSIEALRELNRGWNEMRQIQKNI